MMEPEKIAEKVREGVLQKKALLERLLAGVKIDADDPMRDIEALQLERVRIALAPLVVSYRDEEKPELSTWDLVRPRLPKISDEEREQLHQPSQALLSAPLSGKPSEVIAVLDLFPGSMLSELINDVRDGLSSTQKITLAQITEEII